MNVYQSMSNKFISPARRKSMEMEDKRNLSQNSSYGQSLQTSAVYLQEKETTLSASTNNSIIEAPKAADIIEDKYYANLQKQLEGRKNLNGDLLATAVDS